MPGFIIKVLDCSWVRTPMPSQDAMTFEWSETSAQLSAPHRQSHGIMPFGISPLQPKDQRENPSQISGALSLWLPPPCQHAPQIPIRWRAPNHQVLLHSAQREFPFLLPGIQHWILPRAKSQSEQIMFFFYPSGTSALHWLLFGSPKYLLHTIGLGL